MSVLKPDGISIITSWLPASAPRFAVIIFIPNSAEYGCPYSLASFNIAIFQRGSNAIYRHMSMIQNKKAGVRYLIIDTEHAGRRIDNYIIKALGRIPRTRIYQMLRRGEIRVNGGRIRQDYRLLSGDKVRIPPVFLSNSEKKAIPNSNLVATVRDSMIYEDTDLILLNKPAGLAVHGGTRQVLGLIEILRFMRPEDTELQLVHRLDRDTSGCLLIAKKMRVLRWLHECLRTGRIDKYYLALLKGQMDEVVAEVTAPIRKNVTRSGERMVAVGEHGKLASTRITRWKVFNLATLARVRINSGRTHQIRVHASHIGHPIAGDTKYGDKRFNQLMRELGLKRLFLHASSLYIPALPGNRPEMKLEAPLPTVLEGFLKRLQ